MGHKHAVQAQWSGVSIVNSRLWGLSPALGLVHLHPERAGTLHKVTGLAQELLPRPGSPTTWESSDPYLTGIDLSGLKECYSLGICDLFKTWCWEWQLIGTDILRIKSLACSRITFKFYFLNVLLPPLFLDMLCCSRNFQGCLCISMNLAITGESLVPGNIAVLFHVLTWLLASNFFLDYISMVHVVVTVDVKSLVGRLSGFSGLCLRISIPPLSFLIPKGVQHLIKEGCFVHFFL